VKTQKYNWENESKKLLKIYEHMNNSKVYKNFLIRRGTKKDERELEQLLNKLLPSSILSGCSQKNLSNFLKYLLENPLGIIVVAFEKYSKIGVGYVIAIRNPSWFWSKLIISHPFSIGFFLLIKKRNSIIKKFLLLLRNLKKDISKPLKQPIIKNTPNFSWSPSNSKIARIIFIGVLPDFRGQGLGQVLYSFLAKVLKAEGCTKIEAHIDPDNEASVKLHQKSGWQIQKLKDGDYKAVLEL